MGEQFNKKENTEIVSHWSKSSKMGSINLGINDSITEKTPNVNTPNDVEERTASESLISIGEYNKNSEYIPSNKKAQNKYNSTVNAMLRKAESLFSVPHSEAVAHIKLIKT